MAFDGYYTRMGHAEYEQGGEDFNDDTYFPFQDVEDVLNFRPAQRYTMNFSSALQAVNDDYDRQNKFYPNCVNVSGCYISALSGLLEIFGWEMLLLAVGESEQRFAEVISDYRKFILPYFEVLAASKAPVIMIHDDLCWTSGMIFYKEFYEKYLIPLLKEETQILREKGKKVLFTSDGDYTALIDDIAGCGVNGFVLEPCTALKYVTEKYGKTHVIIGNADTRLLLSGSREDIEAEVRRCIGLGKNCPGYCMAVGNHIPSNTPPENAVYYNEIYEKLSKR